MTRDKTIDDFDGADFFDVRDVIARFEELESERNDLSKTKRKTFDASSESEEYAALQELLNNLKGDGGDHQWRGDWYPVTLIRDSYFEDYAREMASNLYGREIDEAKWPFDCINWEKAATSLQQDYSSVGFRGDIYCYR